MLLGCGQAGVNVRLTFKELKDEISKIVPKSIDYKVDLEAGNIASIDSFAAMPKAITFPKLEPSLVLDVSAEVMRKN